MKKTTFQMRGKKCLTGGRPVESEVEKNELLVLLAWVKILMAFRGEWTVSICLTPSSVGKA